MRAQFVPVPHRIRVLFKMAALLIVISMLSPAVLAQPDHARREGTHFAVAVRAVEMPLTVEVKGWPERGGFTERIVPSDEHAVVFTLRGQHDPIGDRPGPVLMDGQFQIPLDPQTIVIEATVGNFMVAPEYQSGYEVAIQADGHSVATIYPDGSRGGEDGGRATADIRVIDVDLGRDGLERLLGKLNALGYFALPGSTRTAGAGGTVSIVKVTLGDGVWAVDANMLQTAWQQERFEAAQRLIAAAVGIDTSA